MSGAGIIFDVDDAEVQAALRGLLRALDDPSPALEAVGAAVLSAALRTFRDQADPWGRPWAPHAESTLLARGRRAVHGQRLTTRRGNTRAPALRAMLRAQILRDRGIFANSFSAQMIGRVAVAVGTNDKRAGPLTMGADRGAFGADRYGRPIPWGDIPARPVLPIRDGRVDLPPALAGEITDLLRAHLARGAGA